jgi:hypothetical protein
VLSQINQPRPLLATQSGPVLVHRGIPRCPRVAAIGRLTHIIGVMMHHTGRTGQ